MATTAASENHTDLDDELAQHPSIVVHRGILPESWFPKRLDRWMRGRNKRKPATA